MQENLREKLGLGLFTYGEAIYNLFFKIKALPREMIMGHCPASCPLMEEPEGMRPNGLLVIMLKPEIPQRILWTLFVSTLKITVFCLKQNKVPAIDWLDMV